jgi:hypothetical protein
MRGSVSSGVGNGKVLGGPALGALADGWSVDR